MTPIEQFKREVKIRTIVRLGRPTQCCRIELERTIEDRFDWVVEFEEIRANHNEFLLGVVKSLRKELIEQILREMEVDYGYAWNQESNGTSYVDEVKYRAVVGEND